MDLTDTRSLIMPSVIIVGAGITGLSAARVLTDAGWHVRIFDKGQAVGGRFATRRMGDRARIIDFGAQFLTTRDPLFAAAVATWVEAGWVKHWCDGIPILTATELDTSRDGFPRWIGSQGMRTLALQLANDFIVQSPATITHVACEQQRWKVSWVTGDAIRGTHTGPTIVEYADAIIFTQPAPQIIHLLNTSGLSLPDALSQIRYDPCVAVMIDVPQAQDSLLPEPGAVRIDDPASPLLWMASARGRGLISTGDILLLHARGDWSTARIEHTSENLSRDLIRESLDTFSRLGINHDLTHLPNEARMWRYSRCVNAIPEPFLRFDHPMPLLFAGDGFGACPRVEGAWLSGRAAAIALRDAT
jgi:renalase